LGDHNILRFLRPEQGGAYAGLQQEGPPGVSRFWHHNIRSHGEYNSRQWLVWEAV
jgi:hypothetical protein